MAVINKYNKKFSNNTNAIDNKFIDNLYNKFIHQCIKYQIDSMILTTILFDIVLDKYNIVNKKINFGFLHINFGSIKLYSRHIWNSYNIYNYDCYCDLKKIQHKNYDIVDLFVSDKLLLNYKHYLGKSNYDNNIDKIVQIYLKDKKNFITNEICKNLTDEGKKNLINNITSIIDI